MNYQTELKNLFGTMPTFHDSDITGIYLNDKILVLDIKTKVSKVLHSEELYKKYS